MKIFIKASIYILLSIFVIILPIQIWFWEPGIVASTYDKANLPFELFGFCGSLLILFILWREWKRISSCPLTKLIPLFLFLIVCFHFLFYITESTKPSWDYMCYQEAAKLVMEGKNPYAMEQHNPINASSAYLYPPLTAQALAVLYKILNGTISILNNSLLSPVAIWSLVFYIYQCLQFYLIAIGWWLCYQLAKRLGMNSLYSAVTITILFLLNSPLYRTLSFNQVNLWVLDLLLAAILYLTTLPILSGLALSFSIHIKLYPIILIIPLGLKRCWKAVTWTTLWSAVIVLIQTHGGKDWSLWKEFVLFSHSFPEGTYFRDNGLHSIIYNFTHSLGMGYFFLRSSSQVWIDFMTLLASLGFLFWFGKRYILREKMNSVIPRDVKLIQHLIDAISFALIISPVVWEHQYILALPLIIWMVVARFNDKPFLVILSGFLMIGLPIFDVFPFSFHRFIGLLMALVLTSPAKFSETTSFKIANPELPQSLLRDP